MSEENNTMTVRFVEDTQTGNCWFEEKLTNGQWSMMPTTSAMCEGNSRHSLAKEVEKRRQQKLMIFRSYGQDETIPIL